MSSSIFTEKSKLINIGIVVSLLPVCALMGFLLWQFASETSTAAKEWWLSLQQNHLCIARKPWLFQYSNS